MQLEEKIAALVEGALQTAGYEIVRVRLIDGYKRTLQVMIDRLDGESITIKDCEKSSRLMSAIIDVEDPVEGEYDLEVSSPGIDRPLVRLKDFERFKGLEAKIATLLPIEGRKKFKARLKLVSGQDIHVILSDNETELVIAFDNIQNAKLVLNDELMALAAQKNQNL